MISNNLLKNIRLIAFDFDGVFTDNTVYVSEEGVELVRCWRSDGLGLARLSNFGIKALIISTEKNRVVSERARKLKLPCKQGVEDKAFEILATCQELQIEPSQTMFVGNDINDIPALKSVGVPVGVADSHPEIKPYVIHHTKKPGGFGAVREICDLVVDTQERIDI
jgi:3-deoxy-D-manno-octulosonate 8-phosphate phosphatase (KDO 8-P phosphatase)